MKDLIQAMLADPILSALFFYVMGLGTGVMLMVLKEVSKK